MSPAEFIARRQLVGLTDKQLADALGINERSIRGYAAGTYSPVDGVARDLDALVARHTAEVNRLHGAGTVIELPLVPRDRGWEPDGNRPRGWYAALGARLVDRDPDVMLEWRSLPQRG